MGGPGGAFALSDLSSDGRVCVVSSYALARPWFTFLWRPIELDPVQLVMAVYPFIVFRARVDHILGFTQVLAQLIRKREQVNEQSIDAPRTYLLGKIGRQLAAINHTWVFKTLVLLKDTFIVCFRPK